MTGESERAHVPCGSCHRCCVSDLIVLHPECGDDVFSYQTVPAINPLTGRACLALAQRENGHCVYLVAGRCSIHDRAPHICRTFDCRKQARRLAQGMPGLVADGVIRAGRQRMGSLK